MKRSVVMHVEGVPNPHARRFVLENGILVDEPFEFTSYKEAEKSPIAKKLLMLRYVERVLLNRNYITVLKNPTQSPPWEEITHNLKMLIEEHLEQNEPVLFIGATPSRHLDSPDPLLAVIRNVFDQRIRPAAQEDGGDILIESFENGVLNVSMHGSCHTCPYAAQTIKDGVEALLKHISPEVLSVVALQNNVLR